MQCIPDFVSKTEVKKISYVFIKQILCKSHIYSKNVYSWILLNICTSVNTDLLKY
jgi:hypothetical protein